MKRHVYSWDVTVIPNYAKPKESTGTYKKRINTASNFFGDGGVEMSNKGEIIIHRKHSDFNDNDDKIKLFCEYYLLAPDGITFKDFSFKQSYPYPPNDLDGSENFKGRKISKDGLSLEFRNTRKTVGTWKMSFDFIFTASPAVIFTVDPEITNEDNVTFYIQKKAGIIVGSLLVGSGALFWLYRRKQLLKKKGQALSK